MFLDFHFSSSIYKLFRTLGFAKLAENLGEDIGFIKKLIENHSDKFEHWVMYWELQISLFL